MIIPSSFEPLNLQGSDHLMLFLEIQLVDWKAWVEGGRHCLLRLHCCRPQLILASNPEVFCFSVVLFLDQTSLWERLKLLASSFAPKNIVQFQSKAVLLLLDPANRGRGKTKDIMSRTIAQHVRFKLCTFLSCSRQNNNFKSSKFAWSQNGNPTKNYLSFH